MERLLLSPTEAAETLGIGRWKLYDLMRRGLLRSIKIGGCRRIPTSALSEFVAALARAQDHEPPAR
ncbi:MAG TPA: helix-turn-helix domain-containing protein [Mycobacteriales bacterium]|nr:helix-turn-helix domain-containing protein [Mycobacteriales bacterium]